jgi:hypothetical protein
VTRASRFLIGLVTCFATHAAPYLLELAAAFQDAATGWALGG